MRILSLVLTFMIAVGPAHALDGATIQRLMAAGQAAEARSLAVEAAAAGDWRAAHFASWALLGGVGGPVDRGRGLALAEQAGASGDWIARYDQAKALSEDVATMPRARALFTTLAGEGYSPAMLRLADDPALPELDRAGWIERAATLGHPTAFAMLAARQDDPVAAGRLLRQAALSGHLASALTLAELERQDKAEAVSWLMLASARLMGGDYYYGERVDLDRLAEMLRALLPLPEPAVLQPRIDALLAAYALAPWPCNIECEPWRPELW